MWHKSSVVAALGLSCSTALGILVPQPGMEPTSPALQGGFLIIGPEEGLPRWLNGKESTCQCRRHRRLRFDPWVGKFLWRRKWQPTLVFLLEKSHGQSSLVNYSPWGHKESDRTERLSAHAWTVREVLLAVLNAFHISSHLPYSALFAGTFITLIL